MNSRISVLAFLAVVALTIASPMRAAFGLDKLNIDKALNTAKSVTKVAKGVTGIGPEEERVIGESVALEIIGKYGGLVRDEEISKRVNLVGRSLAFYSSRPALDWKFGVLDSPDVNGFSAPSGLVFITRGLYELVGADDDALAGVLAHEITHITARHALKIVSRGEFISGATDLATQHSGDVREVQAKTREVQAQLSQFDIGINQIVKTLLESGFDAPTEYAADNGGRALAQSVGYAPGALRGVLTKLQQKSSGPAPVFSTHPPLSERIARLPADPSS